MMKMAEANATFNANWNNADLSPYCMRRPGMLTYRSGSVLQLCIYLRSKLGELFRTINQSLSSYSMAWVSSVRLLFSTIREHTPGIWTTAARPTLLNRVSPTGWNATREVTAVPQTTIRRHLQECTARRDRLVTHWQGLRPRMSNVTLQLQRVTASGIRIMQQLILRDLVNYVRLVVAFSHTLLISGWSSVSSRLRMAYCSSRFHLRRWGRGDFSRERRLWSRTLAASPSREDLVCTCVEIIKNEKANFILEDVAVWFCDAQDTAVVIAFIFVFVIVAEMLTSSLFLPCVPVSLLANHDLISAAVLSDSVISSLPQAVSGDVD